MSKEFTMSQYRSKEDLYKAKAEYYEALFIKLAERMVETEDLCYDKEAKEYYCAHSGESLDE